jgi:hypothetical protein
MLAIAVREDTLAKRQVRSWEVEKIQRVVQVTASHFRKKHSNA